MRRPRKPRDGQGRASGRRPGFRPLVESVEDRVLLSITPRGAAVTVNTSTAGNQLSPAVAMDANGDSIVVWRDASRDQSPTYESDIRAQRYSPAGAAVHKDGTTAGAQEFLVHSEPDAQFIERNSPAVAMDPAGDFVVAWTRNDTTATGNYLYEIQARVFNAAGVAQTGDLNVSVNTHSLRGNPAVAMDGSGNWVITWQDQGTGTDVFAKKFSLTGTPIALNGSTGPLLINSGSTVGNQFASSVGSDSSGNFVVTWTSFDPANTGPGQEVYARRFNASGVQQGGELHANTTTSGNQGNARVAVAPGGDFIIAWNNDLNDGSSTRGDIVARRYNADGTARSGEVTVNSGTTDLQNQPAVGVDANGNATVAWASHTLASSTDLGIFARRLNSQGQPIEGSDITVASPSGTDQSQPAVAVDSQGDAAFVYRQDSAATAADVMARFYKYVNEAPTLDAIADQSGGGAHSVNLTGITAGGGESQTITVTASSDNTTLVPTPTITYTSPNATGTLSFTPVTGQAGTAHITVTVRDNGGTANGGVDTRTRTFTVTVVGSPTANSQSVSVAHDTAKAITLTGTDPNSPPLPLTYIVTTNPVHGTLSGTAPNLTYTPNAGFAGADSFQFKANNGTSDSNVATVSINVAAAAPTANGQSVSVAHDTAKAITLTGSDPNVPALPLTYIVTVSPAHGTLSGTAPNLTYTPSAGYAGADSFQFKVNNGSVDSSAATVSINVAAAAPTANSQSVSTNADTAKAITLSGSDPNVPPLPLTYIITASPAHGSLSGTAPNVTYTPNAGYSGGDSFQFKVNNGSLDSNIATVSINVNATNHPPTAVNDTASTNDQTPVTVHVLDNDADPDLPNDTLRVTTVGTLSPDVGSVTFNDTTVTYTPAANFHGPVVFSYTITDAGGLTSTANVTVNVSDATPPQVTDVLIHFGTTTLPVGSLARTLPWADIDGVSVVFSEDVALTQGDLALTGVNVPSYPTTGFSYDAATHTASWTLGQFLDTDRVTLTLDGHSAAGVKDTSGNLLGGGDYTKTLNVLPGDVNGDGKVDGTDLLIVRNELPGFGGTYTVFADTDGNGVIDNNDYNTTRLRYGRHLP